MATRKTTKRPRGRPPAAEGSVLIGARVLERIEARAWKRREAAYHLDINEAALSRYLHNAVPDPGFAIVKKMAVVFQTSTDYLGGLTDDPRPPK